MSSNILHNMQINEDEAGETEDFINYSLPPWIYVFKSFLGGDTVAIKTTPTFLTIGTIQHTILNFHLLKLHQTANTDIKPGKNV